ncbi:Cysteine-rich receptor-like protein kinase 10 [Linum perenne]
MASRPNTCTKPKAPSFQQQSPNSQTPNSSLLPPKSTHQSTSHPLAAGRQFSQCPESMGIVCTVFRCIGGKLSSHSRRAKADGDDAEISNDLFFPLRTLQIATNFFSDLNQLGHGGFGPVFKGLMPNGQEIAVKQLSMNSRQGVREFTNEVKLLLRIQHKNLVTLLGCCVEGPEKMLVYEYLPNRSLDYFLFEAPMRILHRDIKASNILLDEGMNAKISDFGLARLFPEDDTHVNTFRISGTHGYMAPEYAMHGYLSVKTDVFSYGILVLEIASGRKNLDRRLGEDRADLLSSAWTLYQAEKTLELLDSTLPTYNRDEVEMCIQLGLLCCQQTVADRPDMNSVNLMLSSDSFSLPVPGKPGMQGRAAGGWTSTGTGTGGTSSALTTTNPNTTNTKSGISSVEDYSRNSMSVSSIDEGR